jgi:magnesium-transporting ATPase (P-type)
VEAAAQALHWEFTGRVPTEAYVLDPGGKRLTYKILAVVPFTSTRKRMSVVVRDPAGAIVVMTKGADNVIFGRAATYLGTTRAALDAHLSAFAADGLRTLVLARRVLTEGEFEAWYREFERAATAVGGGGGEGGGGDRVERIGEAAEAVETGLTVRGVGCMCVDGGGVGWRGCSLCVF